MADALQKDNQPQMKSCKAHQLLQKIAVILLLINDVLQDIFSNGQQMHALLQASNKEECDGELQNSFFVV